MRSTGCPLAEQGKRPGPLLTRGEARFLLRGRGGRRLRRLECRRIHRPPCPGSRARDGRSVPGVPRRPRPPQVRHPHNQSGGHPLAHRPARVLLHPLPPWSPRLPAAASAAPRAGPRIPPELSQGQRDRDSVRRDPRRPSPRTPFQTLPLPLFNAADRPDSPLRRGPDARSVDPLHAPYGSLVHGGPRATFRTPLRAPFDTPFNKCFGAPVHAPLAPCRFPPFI
jgi:hypothetical protein